MTGLYALTLRNCKVFFKDKGMFFTSLITPMILLVLYATFLANVYEDSFSAGLADSGAVDPALIDGTVGGQLVSSLLAVCCITVAFCSNLLMVQDKVTGARRDLTVTPVNESTLALGYFLATAAVTLIVCFAALAVCLVYLAFVGWYLTVFDVLLLIGDVVLLVLFGTALSSCIHYPLSTSGQASAVGTIVSAGYGFICGAYMPISSFGEGLQKVVSFFPGTYGTSLLRNHTLNGVFTQMESSGITAVCTGLKPHSIEDITAIIALYRPGPMDSIPKFIACKHDPSKVSYLIPELEPILGITYGCIVYQEQVISIFQKLAGYSLGQADMLRRAMSKKKVKDIEREREAFINGDPSRNIVGCVANGIDAKAAEAIYDDIYAFANYAFNKAHAAAYAVIAYQTAYCKAHYTKEYMAALLTSVLDNSDKISEYINECREYGIALLPPDVNSSDDCFTVEEGGIRFGLAAIKNIGRGLIQRMMDERRTNGKFRDFQDFCSRMDGLDLNKRAVENLIRAGAFDSTGARRAQLIAVYERVMDGIASGNRGNIDGQIDFFAMGSVHEKRDHLTLPDVPEFDARALMTMEKETTGLYLSGHPMDAYRDKAKGIGACQIGRIMEDFEREEGPVSFADGQKVSIAGVVTSSKTKMTKKNTMMAYVTLEDGTGSIEMLCFAKVLDNCGSYLREGEVILTSGRLSVRDEKAPQLMCDFACPIDTAGVVSGSGYAPKEEKQTLFLRFPSLECEQMAQFKRIAFLFEGKDSVKMRIADTGKLLATTVSLKPAFVEAMRELLGEENVVLR
ncbi:MAG: DNA polymerase III subunit alpha [Oscillospiraceae bacterium]|nr:DNA polymerase III subunit alpha [Oscillospiraceae bacterium]